MSQIKPNQYDGELAALLHQREMESLSCSPLVESLVGAAGSGAEKLGFPIGGLIRWALKNGQTPLDTIVEQIESSARAEIARHEERLGGHDKEIRELWEKLQSQEAQAAYRAAVFHGMRTSDPAKHARLGALTINCICADDLTPESLDEMMRPAVELTVEDIRVLKRIADKQSTMFPRLFQEMDIVNNPRSVWRDLSHEEFITPQNQITIRASLARLQSFAFGTEVATTDSTWLPNFTVLPGGMKFLSRLRTAADPD